MQSALSILGLAGLVALGSGIGLAQELDVKWLVGTWKAEIPSPGGQGNADRVELVIQDNGTFTGDTQSARSGLIQFRHGAYRVTAADVTLEATAQGGPAVLNGTKLTWTLKRRGEELDGTVYRHFNNTSAPVSFRKVK
jgi:hypothetical protein